MKILVVDDNLAFRASFRKLLSKIPFIEDIFESKDGETAIRLVNLIIPDLIFMDITMPKVDGFEVTKQILKKHPAMKVIILTVHVNKALLEKSIAVGAVGYLVKNKIYEELMPAIEKIGKGGTYLSSEMKTDTLA